MSLATFGGLPVLTCRVQIPAYGLRWAEVECASDQVLTGAQTLVIDDLSLQGTILSGGTYQTRTRYRVVAGGGGWGQSVPARSYASDAGVKLAIVLRDVAAAVGETMGTVDPTISIGPAYVRPAGPASQVLQQLSPQSWYVDEAGVTQIGRRPAAPFTGPLQVMIAAAEQARYEVAPSDGQVSPLLPGVQLTINGVTIEAVDVEHEIDGDGTLRSTLWARGIADTSRLSEALRRIVQSFTAGSKFCAPWEYRVVQVVGDRLNLQATRASSGMPDLQNVRIRPGVSGVKSHPPLGSLVEVHFVNGDPSQPRVCGFDDQDGAGAVAQDLTLQAGATGQQPTEHATSAEALVIAMQGLLAAIGPAIGSGYGTAVTALSVSPAFDSLLSTIAARSLASSTKTALITALAAKSADSTGQTPSLGWPSVKGG